VLLSAIAVAGVAFATRIVPVAGMLAYLAIGVFIIVCAGAGARWLRALPDNAVESLR